MRTKYARAIRLGIMRARIESFQINNRAATKSETGINYIFNRTQKVFNSLSASEQQAFLIAYRRTIHA